MMRMVAAPNPIGGAAKPGGANTASLLTVIFPKAKAFISYIP